MEDFVDYKEDVVTQQEKSTGTQPEEPSALQACQAEVAAWKEKFIQINADLVNYRRRVEKDQAQWISMAQVKVLSKVLSIVDNFDRAMVEKPATQEQKLQAWVAGIQMIHSDFVKLLASFDIKEVSCTGQFDPSKHEALMNVASDTHQSGDIVELLEKGYQMGDIILRPAKVSVAQ